MPTEVSVVGEASAVYVNGALVWSPPVPPPPPPPPPPEPRPPATAAGAPYASSTFGSGRYA